MYTIFDTILGRYHRKKMDAICLNDPPLEIHRAWKGDTPLVPWNHPWVFEFEVNASSKYPDSYWNASGFLLIHQRLAAVLNAFGTPHEVFSVVFRDRRTKQVLPHGDDYQVYRILATAPLLEKQGTADRDTPLQLNPFPQTPIPPVFLDEEFRHILFVHQDVRTAIEAQGITGVEFFTVDAYNKQFLFPLT